MAQIELSHITKKYLVAKKKKGLRGEIVGYIGPNGVGKSTTIKMMCGIMMPTSGEIRINGISSRMTGRGACRIWV